MTPNVRLIFVGVITVATAVQFSLSWCGQDAASIAGNGLAMSFLSWLCLALAVLLFCYFWQQQLAAAAVLAQVKRLPACGDEASLSTLGDDQLVRLGDAATKALLREHAIADHALDLLLALDKDLVIRAANPSSRKHLGYLPEELHGRALTELIKEGDSDNLIEKIADAAAGQPCQCHLRCLGKLGTLVDFDVRIEWSPRTNLYFAVATDVTAAKTVERARGQYLAMLSHDIRTPLSSAVFGAECLRAGVHGQLSETGAKDLEKVQRSLRLASDLMNEIVDLEKSLDGQLVLQRQQFDVSAVALELAGQLAGLAQERQALIVVQSESVEIFADQRLVTRVILNLLSNAIKYSPAGAAVILSVQNRRDHVRVSVQDSGPGISKQWQAAVFDRYFQVSDATAKAGHGLGLAICRAFVEAHDGLIGVDSEPGAGSTFWFTLPCN